MTKPDRLNQLVQEIGDWATENFSVHAPRLGVLEEVGEMTHCILKRFQGIRGFDKPEHFKKEFGDALADAGVYLLHDIYMAAMRIIDDPCESEFYKDFDFDLAMFHEEAQEFLAKLSEDVSWLLDGNEYNSASVEVHDAILQKLFGAARQEGLDFMEVLEATWAKVKQRNWVENPTDAHVVAEQPLPANPPGNEPVEPDIHK